MIQKIGLLAERIKIAGDYGLSDSRISAGKVKEVWVVTTVAAWALSL